MGSFLGVTMKRLVNALILLPGLGCKADSWHDPGMVYGFDNVSLRRCRTTSSKAFKLSDQPSRLNHQPTSRGHHVSMT
jgi:hypothetical protein